MPIEGNGGPAVVGEGSRAEVVVAVAVAGRKVDRVQIGRRLWRRLGRRVPCGSDRGIRNRCCWSRDGHYRCWRSDWWRRDGPVESMAVRRRLEEGTRDGDVCDSHDLVGLVVVGHGRRTWGRNMALAHSRVADVHSWDLDLGMALAQGVGRARRR